MPQRNPSPPARADIEGICEEERDGFEDDEDEELVAFFPQQITDCLPLASIAQKKPLSPNEAEMGPIDPNPDAISMRKRKMRGGRREREGELENPEGGLGLVMVWGFGFGFGFGECESVLSWSDYEKMVVGGWCWCWWQCWCEYVLWCDEAGVVV